MKRQVFFLSLYRFLLFSCNEKVSSEFEQPEFPIETEEFIVIRERNPDIPLILSMPRERNQTRNATPLEFDDYLGMSFKTDYYPFESVMNVGTPVIDIQKLTADNPTWATSRVYRNVEDDRFAYHGFDRYESNSTITRKVNSGFSINLGIFKIGKKKTMTEVFTENIVNQSTTVFGQVDINVYDAIYDLTLNSNRIRQVNDNYLHQDFLLDLYNMPVEETFRFYGGFVLSKFMTGGRATALYTGKGQNYTTSQEIENEMTKNLSVSFSHKSDSVNGELGFGKKYGNGSSLSNKISQFSTSVKTLGGQYGTASFTAAQDFENVEVNLTPWLQSLNDPKTHTIIDIFDEGLVPLTAFVLEDNLKNILQELYQTWIQQENPLQEPYLLCVLPMHYPQCGLFFLTRFLDLSCFIMLKSSTTNWQELLDYAESILPDLPVKYTTNQEFFNRSLNLSDLTQPKKVIDRVNNKMYLLYAEDKVGLSIHLGYDGYLLDTYTIRDMADSIPESEFNSSEILNYTLIAL
ncbi:MAG: MAC/perforin domain-containing protein [Rikenellaceae bacterium]|nr:MAC/perforin domain-containing protein [Rikenellaceae bacterium]